MQATYKSDKYRYKLRGFDSQNPMDIESANLMFFHPLVMKAKGYWEPAKTAYADLDLSYVDKKFQAASSTLTARTKSLFFAIADHKDLLVGWIWFYRNQSSALPLRVSRELGLSARNSRSFEVSYERLLSERWPKSLVKHAAHVKLRQLKAKRKGVIVSGLGKAIAKMKRMNKELTIVPKKLVFHAYTYPGNIASELVLSRNRFKKYPKQYSYGGSMHNLWVKVV